MISNSMNQRMVNFTLKTWKNFASQRGEVCTQHLLDELTGDLTTVDLTCKKCRISQECGFNQEKRGIKNVQNVI